MKRTWPLLGLVFLAAGGCASHRHPARDVLAAPEGVYHWEDQADALNIQLNPDGTFHATFCGCDYDGSSAGRWHRDGTEIVLGPQPGAETIFWIGSGHLRELKGRLTPQGVVVGEGIDAGRWLPGRVCTVCGGTLGPTGLRSCPEPLPKECGG
jgi:hypothetical protein